MIEEPTGPLSCTSSFPILGLVKRGENQGLPRGEKELGKQIWVSFVERVGNRVEIDPYGKNNSLTLWSG